MLWMVNGLADIWSDVSPTHMSFAHNRAVVPMARPEPSPDLEARFRNLVQSPLRAGLLRFLNTRPEESFDVESLMAAFGRLRLDIDNCLNELVDFGVVQRVESPQARYMAGRPSSEELTQLLDTFLERRADISTEDQS